MKPQVHRYLESLAAEVHSQSSRIRDLIGDKHWLSDGHQKEYLLRETLCRHCPAGTIISRGFIVSPRTSEACSKEQDILILDAHSEAPVFNQGGVVVGFPRSVLASISVKTRLSKENIRDSVTGLQSVRAVATASGVNPNLIHCGAYFFEESDLQNNEKHYEHISMAVSACDLLIPPLIDNPAVASGPNVFATARDTFFKLEHGALNEQNQTVTHKLRGYHCSGLATAEFLADLLDHIAWRRGLTETQFMDFSECINTTPIGIGEVEIIQKVGG